MQLGTRWSAGTLPPTAVPRELHAAIVEAETRSEAAPPASWTLTWLEGLPIAELDTGWEVIIVDGEAVARPWES